MDRSGTLCARGRARRVEAALSARQFVLADAWLLRRTPRGELVISSWPTYEAKHAHNSNEGEGEP